jgi:hypothetical protein
MLHVFPVATFPIIVGFQYKLHLPASMKYPTHEFIFVQEALQRASDIWLSGGVTGEYSNKLGEAGN